MSLELILRFATAAIAFQQIISGFEINVDRTETGHQVTADYNVLKLIFATFLVLFTVLGYGLFRYS